MRYEFTKMQSIGNDFILLDGVSTELNITADIARRLADRHFGVGCDQVLLAQPGLNQAGDDADELVFRIFNQDGGEVAQCGNGARCFAKFARARGLTTRRRIRARTRNQRMTLVLNADESVTVDMGAPVFSPAEIPFVAERAEATYSLDLDAVAVAISALAIGNPHAVLQVPEVAAAPVSMWGPMIEKHARFPLGANAGFMQIVARDHIRLRVHERGVGETLGCGSGACAAVVAGVRRGLLDAAVTVSLPGGDVEVHWPAQNQPMFLRGSAHTVFSGAIDL